MANDLNQCNFIGRLGRDPEVSYMPSGKAVCNLSIAVSKSWKDKNTGAMNERTEWVRLVAYDRLAEVCGEYLRKGSQAFFSGEMSTRKWQDKQTGQDRYSTEIIVQTMQMLDSKGGSGGNDQQDDRQPQQQSSRRAPAPAQEPAPATDDFIDDIPF